MAGDGDGKQIWAWRAVVNLGMKGSGGGSGW